MAPTGSSTSRVGRDCAAAPGGCGPSGHCGSGAAGEHEKRQPATTSTGGRTAVSARTAVDFAVPFSPRTSTPPIAGEIALRMSASRMSSMATTALNGNWVTEPPGGCPSLQAGKESGAPRRGAGNDSRPYGAAPAVFRSHVRSYDDEDSVPVPGLSRPGTAGYSEPHVRLRPGGVEPHPGRTAGPLAPGRRRHVVCAVRPGADRHEEASGPGVPQRSILRAVAAGAAAPAPGVRRVLRQARPLPQVQVPLLAAVRALHPQRVHHARRPAAPGQDSGSCPVRLVLAGCGRDRAGPGDGDHLPGSGRTMVRDLHH